MKTYIKIKELLKQEFLKRGQNYALYIDVYTLVDEFIYGNFYSKPIKKKMTKKSSQRNNK